MQENLRDTLSNLDLSLDDKLCNTDPYHIPWWCFFPCWGLGCHGAGSSVNYCPMGNCSSQACSNNADDWGHNCHGAGVCALNQMNYMEVG
jgi:hypothetical protein